nr:TonB-dependent receptor [Pseudomonas petroselini]
MCWIHCAAALAKGYAQRPCGAKNYQLRRLRQDAWTVALNSNNLFDKSYYNTVGNASWGNFYGEPRNFTVSLKGNF